MDKKTVVHLQNGILCSSEEERRRKKKFLPFATAWMELESIVLSEISQSERDQYHMIALMTGI